MSVQKIRLPSVNDIFPHSHHQQSQKLNYTQAHTPVQQPQAHMTGQTRALIGMAHSVATVASSVSTSYPQSQPMQPQRIVGPPSPLSNQPMMAPYPVEQHSSVPVYYYQPIYYTHSPGTPQSAQQMYHPHQVPNTTSPMESPIYAQLPYSSSHLPLGAPVYHPQVYMNMDNGRYRIQKQRQSNAWTDEDDTLLKYLKEARNLGWREISLHFRNRTANGCQFRWRRISALAKSLEKKNDSDDDSVHEDQKRRENSLDKLLN